MTLELVFITLIIFLYGIVIGSFLNVCIYRIPRKESLVTVRSHCMSCGYQLKWYQMIPLFSWIFLRGRCHQCQARISVQYPLVELTNGLLYLLIFLVNGFGSRGQCLESILYCIMGSALLVLSVIDIRTFEIAPQINWFIGAIGIIHISIDAKNWIQYVAGFFAVSVILEILLIVTKGKAIGGGDVKLMAAAGLMAGWKNIILAFFLACIFGSVIHLILMKLRRKNHVLAMGPYLSAGIMVAVLWGDRLLKIYVEWLLR